VPRPRTIVEALAIDSFADNECYVQFRFRSKAQLHRIFNCLQVPDTMSFNDEQWTHKFGGEEVLLFALEYLASGNSIESIIRHQFGRDESQWSRAYHWFITWITDTCGHLLHSDWDYWVPKLHSFNKALCIYTNSLAVTYDDFR